MMKMLLSALLSIVSLGVFAQAITLHTENPHYLSYRNAPILLITSAEHYGAVLNLDFDYVQYLQTMQEEGMNYTRIFVGSYVEIPGSFGIEHNTLAPAVGRFIAPWKRTTEAGLYEGENKFDLSQWNEDYFARLKDFISEADQRDIIVEVTFFCSTYQDTYWERNPFNAANNINQLPIVDRTQSNTLANGKLTDYQKEMVSKIVTELNDFDNIFYEIQNEPWADDPQDATRTLKTLDPEGMKWAKWAHTASEASLAWQQVMVDQIVQVENSLPKKHLIAQNYTNFKHALEYVDPKVSILNFHYNWPEVVSMNYAWDRPISFDESGFAGKSDTTYLRQAWGFMLAGGAIFNNLDYSFYVNAEDGSGENNAPGGGSTRFRKQLTHLHEFLESFDYIKMQPEHGVVFHAPGLEWQAISEAGRQYAIFFSGKATGWVKLNLPEGDYALQFVSPYTGKVVSEMKLKSKGEVLKVELPEFDHMLAVKIKG